MIRFAIFLGEGLTTLAIATLQTAAGTGLQSETVAVLATAVATIILAFATLYQAIKTGGMVTEMREARFGELEPRVKATLGWIGPVAVCLKIQNLGRGPAKNLSVEYSFKPGDAPSKTWSQLVLAPNEYSRLLLEPTYLDELATKYDEIVVSGTCENITGMKYDIHDVIKLKELRETLKKTPQLLETSSAELLREIQQELERLNGQFDSLLNVMRNTGIVTKTKAEKAAEDAETISHLREMQEKAKQQG